MDRRAFLIFDRSPFDEGGRGSHKETTMKHTPGPWTFATYSPKRFGLGRPGGSAFFFLQCVNDNTSSPDAIADARLIAAAPDLLAAAKAAVAYDAAIHSCANDPNKMASFCSATGDDLDSLYANWIAAATAAIARAEGGEA